MIVNSCATDFCVDTTVRPDSSRDYEIVVVAEGHTIVDRQRVDAVLVIRYHNWVRQGLIPPRTQIQVLLTSSAIAQVASAAPDVSWRRPTTDEADKRRPVNWSGARRFSAVIALRTRSPGGQRSC
jgi:hypothetical protein